MNAFDGRTGVNLQRALMVGAWLLVAVLALGIVYIASSLRYIGTGVAAANTITVGGEGTAYAVPDTAEFSYSVVSDAATVAAAQQAATAKINVLTAYLKSAGIADADIQTTDYEVSPQYKYQSVACPVLAPTTDSSASNGVYCPPSSNQVLVGYEVTQTTDVKVRDTSKAGDLLAGVGQKGATNVSGLQFTVDDPTAVQTQARDNAIADAKSKADELARELGVSIVRVTGFSENQGGQPTPVVYSMAAGATNAKAAVAPQISTGQNKVVDDVTITYEIR